VLCRALLPDANFPPVCGRCIAERH
jgi:hypothetical protein